MEITLQGYKSASPGPKRSRPKTIHEFSASWILPQTSFYPKGSVIDFYPGGNPIPPFNPSAFFTFKVLVPGSNPTQLVDEINQITSEDTEDAAAFEEKFRRIKSLFRGSRDDAPGFGATAFDTGLTPYTFATPLTGIRVGNLGRITAIPASELAQTTADGYGVSEGEYARQPVFPTQIF